jgi:ribosomal protein L11 methyltransferase
LAGDGAYAAIEVGERLRLAAPGGAVPEDGRVAVAIARGAFGSGEHETTAACLQALESLPGLRGALVLDLGCGTGVLAIAAVALGARAAVAVDIEPAAAAVARANCRHNDVAEKVRVAAGTLAAVRAGAGFGVVAANIPASVLLAEAPALLARAAPGAPLVLSGILWEELFDIEQRYRRLGCATLRRRMLEEYALLLLRAPAR